MLEDAIPLGDLRRALVVKLRHHGDVLLTSPVFQVLKNHAPRLEIDALVYADTAPMLALHPAIAEIHVIDRAWRQAGGLVQMAAEWRLYRRLRARQYDLLVHLTEHPRGAWLARALGVRHAVAPRTNRKGAFWRRSFTHLYAEPIHVWRHRVERNLDALRRIGVYPRPDERALILVPGEEATVRVEALLAQHGLRQGQFIHFHPASRWLFKCLPVKANAELIDQLHEAGHAIVVTAARDPRELKFIDEILARSRAAAVNLAGQLSLKEVAALTKAARLFVGVDSAPMHMAAALGTPAVALFGPSGDREWGPWRIQHRIVASTGHPCRPCGLDGCGGGKVSDCLVTLSAEQIARAATDLMALTDIRT